MKKCKTCGVPLEGFMYKWVISKLFGIKTSEKNPEVCSKCEDKEIKEASVEKPQTPQQ